MRTFRTNTKKQSLIYHGELECKCKKPGDTWSNRQVWTWGMKQSRAKADSFPKGTHWSWRTPSFNSRRDDSTPGHQQMNDAKIRLITFFAVEDCDSQHNQQK